MAQTCQNRQYLGRSLGAFHGGSKSALLGGSAAAEALPSSGQVLGTDPSAGRGGTPWGPMESRGLPGSWGLYHPQT